MTRRRRRLLVVTMLLAAATACGGEQSPTVGAGDDSATTTTGADDPTSTTREVSSPTSSTGNGGACPDGLLPGAGTSTPARTTDTSIAGATERAALLTDVRAACHAGFDRVTFEFEPGTGVPGVEVGYVEPPIRQDGSGHEVEVEGGAFLSIRMQPASGVDLSAETYRPTYEGPTRIEATGGDGPITEVVRTGDFEAVLTWVVGVDERRPFVVVVLRDPVRVVVDVVND